MSLNATFGGIIYYKVAHEALQHNGFRGRPKAALSKDGFALAIDNEVAWIGQLQDTAKQIRLSSTAIDPNGTRD